ncbi:enamelin-like [Hyperolius riggenbachi]|uniref:enamelin-like n=1 Tax=Hyperolius riggenbachi TaxID=752182 RepID=UPI0035A30EB3
MVVKWGNYFGFLGFGGRPPYNSEEANEDEEGPKEKDPPKPEPPITESTNTSTVDTNSTTVDHGLANSTVQNESLVGDIPQSPNIRFPGHNTVPKDEFMIPSINGRQVRILRGPPQPSHHNHFLEKQRYYTGNRVLTARGGNPSNIQPSDHLINKPSFIPQHPRVISGGSSPTHGNRISGRVAFQPVNVGRAVTPDPKLNIPRIQQAQKYNSYNAGVRGDFPKLVDPSHGTEHLVRPVNRNNVPDHNIIVVQPQYKEHFSQYSRYPVADERLEQNIPRGIFLSEHQPIRSDTGQSNNIYHIKSTSMNHNTDTVVGNEGPYLPSGTQDSGNTWRNRQISIGREGLGEPAEVIYLISTFPSDAEAANTYNSQKQNLWENQPEQKENTQYITVPKENNIFIEEELYGTASTTSQPENHPWQGNEFTTTPMIENMQPQPYRRLGPSPNPQFQIPSADYSRKDLYANDYDRHPNNQRHVLLVSKPELPKTQEQVQLSVKGPSYRFRETNLGSQKPFSTLDHAGPYTDYDTNPQTFLKNMQHTGSRPFDPVETIQNINGEDMHLKQNNPIHVQLVTIPEVPSWGYNPQKETSGHKQLFRYDSYPSGMRVHLPYQREIIRDYENQRYYMCSLPFLEDPGRELTNSLLYLCCKLAHVDQGSPSRTVDNIPEFRLSLKEYNELVPNQDRAHRQHTRNVGDAPKTDFNQPCRSMIANCNATNTRENPLNFRSESRGMPHPAETCDDQNIEYPNESFNAFPAGPCGTRGDNYLPSQQEVLSSQKKTFVGKEKAEIPPPKNVHHNEQLPRDNDVRTNKGTGKLLQILTCPRDTQMHVADTPASLDNRNIPDAFTLKHNVPNEEPGVGMHDGSSVPHMAGSDPGRNTPDCLILNK